MTRTANILAATIAVGVLALAAWTPASAAGERASAPARLADTGLYADFSTGTIAADVQPFVPQYPLWSDGATKRRWIRLPPGAAIDASDPDAWRFPIGTKLWKEFSFGRRVETRYLERGADGEWIFAAYAWSADGSDAVLAPERGLRGACESRPGLRHDIPGALDCRICHEGGASPVLGFSALQLSSDRDPLAPHAEAPIAGALDLDRLVASGAVTGLPTGLVERAPRIRAASPTERAALGYMHSNCGICHNERGPLATLGLALDVSLADAPDAQAHALRTAVGVASRYRPRSEPAGVRIAAGAPEQSVLVQRMSSRNAVAQMPPLGTRAVDEQALALIEAWIRDDLVAGTRAPIRSDEPLPIPIRKEP